MENCLQIYKDVEVKLERQLTEDEVKFLQWVLVRYKEEKGIQTA